MADFDKNIEAIETTVLNEQRALERTLRTVLIVFITLIAVVLGTSSYSWNRINSNFGPDGIVEYGEAMVNILADQPQQLTVIYNENKEQWAAQIVDEALDAIPRFEELLRNNMTVYADTMSMDLKHKLFPEMVKFIEGSAPELKANYAAARKENPELKFEEHLVQLFIDFMDKEIKANIIDFDAAEELAGELQQKLYRLHTAKEPLTKKELAERKIIINLVLISKMGTADSPFIQEFHQFLKERVGVSQAQLEEIKILDDKELRGVGASTEELHP